MNHPTTQNENTKTEGKSHFRTDGKIRTIRATLGSKYHSNLDSLLLTLPLHVFILAALRQALGKTALVLQLGAAVRLVFALLLCYACGANITCTATRLTDTNTATMKPLLATNTADHEPENSEGSTAVRKRKQPILEVFIFLRPQSWFRNEGMYLSLRF